jgi:hypothetical protein
MMKKNIDIPDDIRWDLEILAKQEKKDLKTFIQDVLISLVRGKKKLLTEMLNRSSNVALQLTCLYKHLLYTYPSPEDKQLKR